MRIFMVLEFLFAAIFVIAAVTQIIIPLFTNKPLFPLLRQKTEEEKRLLEVSQKLQQIKLQTQVDELENEVSEAQREEQEKWARKFRVGNQQ